MARETHGSASRSEDSSTTSVVIAGSRSFGSGIERARVVEYVDDVVEESGFDVDEVVSGTARGADQAGEAWAEREGLPVERFPADWDEHGKAAGPIRNEEMADYADRVIAIWDGQSVGTRNMIETGCAELGEDNVFVHEYR